MIFIPAWVTNVLFFVTFYLSGFQHVQLRRPNPITNLQFFMMAFSLLMIVIVALYNRTNPWLSLGLPDRRGKRSGIDDPPAPHAAANEAI